jgi:hypothetical protein
LNGSLHDDFVGSRIWRWLAVIAAIVLAAIFFVYGALRLRREVVESATHPTETTVDLGAVLLRVRELNRLETASMRIMTVSRVSQSYQFVPDSLSGDTISFLAVGDVVAGVDLSTLRESDIRRGEGDSVTIRLPPPQILVSRIDNRESHVLNRKTGFLRKSDPDMEGRLRSHAESAIRNVAMQRGILPMAATNAESRLAGLLRSLGFKNVRFVTTPPMLPPRPTEG